MRKVSEESKTPRKRRTEEERRNSPDGHGYSGARFDGPGNGCQSLSLDRDDRQEGNTDKRSGHAIVGGILSQLITKTQSQINDTENNLCDLKNQLRELEQLSNEFEFQENP
ncbi:hypothetical protein [Nodularia chucula]|uniref:hypothetical protein n=1 Tax=Nodularia chucula TaxID=3093667 RepID=UPI0039C74B2B